MQGLHSITAKQVFLIDGIGALLTAVSLSQVLARHQSLFGMPLNILYLLAAIALLYTFYSLGCYFLLKTKWSRYLKIIAIANTLYCLITLCLVFAYYRILTVWDFLYFCIEIILVMSLVLLEINIVKKSI